MKDLWIKQILLLCICSLFIFVPNRSDAQYGPMGGMGMGAYGMGMGMGMGYPGMGMGAEGGPGAMVTVKYGEKVYDAVFGDLVEARIFYIQVPADTIGVHYFDDGTHGDEVAFDGMPSYIIINRDTYLGPFAIKYKNMLENAKKAASDMGPLEFYNLSVATKDKESKVTKLLDWEETFNNFLNDKIAARLTQFEGYDDERFIKAIDPSLFESLEGFGGMAGGGMGIGGMIPDLPPPPGLPNPTEMQFGTPSGTANEPAQPAGESGRFNPIQRARDVTGSMQAVEGLNTLNQ